MISPMVAVVRPAVEEARHGAKAGAELGPARQQVARIGLQRLEAALDDGAAKLPDVVEAAHRRKAPFVLEQVAPPDAPAAAMRPVERDALAERTAEQRIDRNAQRLRLDVEAGILDHRDGLRVQPAMGHARHRVQRRADASDLARVHADHDVGKLAQQRRQPAGAIAFVVFGPADEAVVGHDLQEREDAPARVGMQVLKARDPHHRLQVLERNNVQQGSAAHEPAADCRRRDRRGARPRSVRRRRRNAA